MSNRMIARVEGMEVSPEILWWPELNFDQFRWPGRVGSYELEIPWAEFVERIGPAYRRCVVELRADDSIARDHQSPLTTAGYPPLEELPTHPAAFFEAVCVYLRSELLGAFLTYVPSAAQFMVNSIEGVSTSPTMVVVRGRGYHGSPGFALLE